MKLHQAPGTSSTWHVAKGYLYIKPEKENSETRHSEVMVHSLLINLIQKEIEIKFSEPVE